MARVKKRAYEDWQLARLRNAVRLYYEYGTGSERSAYNWKDVSEGIEEYTGAQIAPERLRQFVEGINVKGGGKKFPVPKDIGAIVSFLTDEHVNLLQPAELESHQPDIQAALRLFEYLKQNADRERITPPQALAGTYRTSVMRDDEILLIILTLQAPDIDGIIHAHMTTQNILARPTSQLTREDKKEIYAGWGLMTPEDNLLFFLKHTNSGANSYFHTLASENIHLSSARIDRLTLLNHDYPATLDDTALSEDELQSLLLDEFSYRARTFERISAPAAQTPEGMWSFLCKRHHIGSLSDVDPGPMFTDLDVISMRGGYDTLDASDQALRLSLLRKMFAAARRADQASLTRMAALGFPVAERDPHTGETILHILAAHGARDVLLDLMDSAKLDFLARDRQGRFASEVAYVHGNDPELASLLVEQERKQAAEQGVTLTYRPQR